MSNYGSVPPPGSYAPPNQIASTQGYNAQQQQGYQQPQTSPYQPGASNHAPPGHSSKVPGGAFGQMMNQAVTTGKPMLNKLSKTISSKLGNKPAPGPPQHLQSYQNYQTHQGQQNAPQGAQQQQQQWQQSQQPPPQLQPQPQPHGSNTNAYASAQQSPYQQSNYATPVSGMNGQSNYFPQQSMQPSQAHTPQTQPQNAPGLIQGGQSGMNQQMETQQGQYSLAQGPNQNFQYQNDQFGGQQMGVIGNASSPGQAQTSHPQYNSITQPPPVSPVISNQTSVQPQWEYSSGQPPSASVQQHPSPLSSPQPYQSVLSTPVQQISQQQWQPLPSHHPQIQGPPDSAASPPPQQMNMQPQIPPNKPMQSQPPTPVSQYTTPPPSGFAAELPAEMGNLQLTQSPQRHGSSTQPQQYQAYNATTQAGTPSSGHRIPRRAVSTSGQPLSDPWRFVDPVTELPTREFYILADLLFDALDRKFGPQNSGLLEGPKILASWVELTEDAHSKLRLL
jgi:hypothetical protein